MQRALIILSLLARGQAELTHDAVGRHMTFGTGPEEPSANQCDSTNYIAVGKGTTFQSLGGCSQIAPLPVGQDAGFSALKATFKASLGAPLNKVVDISFSAHWDYQYYDKEKYLCAPVVARCATTLVPGTNSTGCVSTTGQLAPELEIDSKVTVTDSDSNVYHGVITGGSNCEVPVGADATFLTIEADIEGLGHLSVHAHLAPPPLNFISVELRM